LAKITIERFIRKLGRQRKITEDVLRMAIDRTTRILRRKIIEQHFSNTSAPGARSVRKQSGKLQKSIRFSKAVPDGKGFSSTMTIGTKYASTHVAQNRRGKKRITGKKGLLAIPTRFARNAAGVPIAPPRDSRWKPTHIAGNIIFGQLGSQEVPLFVLKKSVVVPQRISIARDILKPGEEILKQQILRETKKIL
jgi:hypothetical protein